MAIVSQNPNDLSAGLSNLARMFAPTSPQELYMGGTLQQKREEAARNVAAAAAADARYPGSGAFLTLDPTGGVKQFGTAEALKRALAGASPASLDGIAYAIDRDAGKTFTGKAMEPLSANQVRVLPPGVAGDLGTPDTQFGVVQTNKDQTSTLPGPRGAMSSDDGDTSAAANPGSGATSNPAVGVPATTPAPPARFGFGGPTQASADPVIAAVTRAPAGNTSSGGVSASADPVVAAVTRGDSTSSRTASGGRTINGRTDPGDRALTAEERRGAGLGPNVPAVMGGNGQIRTLGGNGVTVNNNGTNTLVNGLNEQFVENAKQARAAADQVRSINAAREQLDAPGGIISGAAAGDRLSLQKYGSLLGLADADKITNTESLKAALKPFVLEAVKGLGNNPSNADREFAGDFSGGNINLDEGSMRRILDLNERSARAKIDRHNAMAEDVFKNNPALEASRPLAFVEAPAVYQRRAVTTPGGTTADTGQRQPAPGAIPPQPVTAPVRVGSPEEARRLPPGTPFQTPDGRVLTAPGGSSPAAGGAFRVLGVRVRTPADAANLPSGTSIVLPDGTQGRVP